MDQDANVIHVCLDEDMPEEEKLPDCFDPKIV